MHETNTIPNTNEQVDQHVDLIESSGRFDMLANPYDRMEYVHLTDRLIQRLEGSADEPRPDVVLFLDKSARPVAWLTRELWPQLAREPGTKFEDGIVPERPDFIFLNIDSKRQALPSEMDDLRSLFTVEHADSAEAAQDMPTLLDGKRILVVDEIGVSHATRVKAQAYMEMAFPDAIVDSFTWMDQGPQTNYGGQGSPPKFNKETFEFEGEYGAKPKPMTNNLRWYKDRSDLTDLPVEIRRQYDDGRGVIDLDAATEDELAHLDHPRRRHGRQWLSARPATRLPETQQLAREIKLLAQELKEGVLPYWPSEDREDFAERVELTSGTDVRTFTQFREWFKDAWWKNWNDAEVIIKQKLPDQSSYQRVRSLGTSVVGAAKKYGLFTEDMRD